MLMIDAAIRVALARNELEIVDFSEDSLQGASYDFRIGHEILVSNRVASVDPEKTGAVRLEPGEFVLMTTLEKVKLGHSIAGNIGGKTYFTRKGLILLSGLQIDPGFEGVLAIAAYNSSPKSIVLEYGEKICSVQFFQLPAPVEKVYDPSRSPELRDGRLPRVEKDYFRDLEVQSLTEVQQELRQLTQNVSMLTTSVQAMDARFSSNFETLNRLVTGIIMAFVASWIAVVISLVLRK